MPHLLLKYTTLLNAGRGLKMPPNRREINEGNTINHHERERIMNTKLLTENWKEFEHQGCCHSFGDDKPSKCR
jgi:hypothetical protein